jgi:hypothetical protein
LFPEKHAETDDGAVDEQTTEDRHDHCGHLDGTTVSEDGGKRYFTVVSTCIFDLILFKRKTPPEVGRVYSRKRTYSHKHQETSQEPTKVDHGTSGAFNKVIGVTALAADPVR